MAQITFRGNPIHTSGELPAKGERAPAFELVAGDLSTATAAVLAHLDRDGVPREARRTLVEGENSSYGGPAILADPRGLYVAIARPPDSPGGHEQVFVTRLECEAPAPDRCAPQDALPSGDDCATVFGFAWNGMTCAPIVCGCLGTECDRLAPLEEECLADHAGCF
jgi:hypothetical protein